jgi:oligosaccharide repeat unit polymerase
MKHGPSYAMSETNKNLAPAQLAWWLHPISVFVLLNGITGLASYLAGSETYLHLWRTPKYFTGDTLLITLGILIVFSASVWLGLANQPSYSSKSEWQGSVSFSQALRLFRISFWLCVMAYGVWIYIAVSRGLGLSVFRSIFTGGVSIYTFRDFFETMPGVTTGTQFGIATVVLGSLIGPAAGWKIVRPKLMIVFLLAFVRALIYSERLAFLELAVPFLVLWLAQPASWTSRRSLRTLIRIVPVLGISTIYIVFTVFEYFRSWSIYYSARESSLLSFGLYRLLGYYVTSANNSAFLITSLRQPLGAPYFSFYFLWHFPLLSDFVHDAFGWVHFDYDTFMNLLAAGANPEFNNPGGLLSPVIDFGVLGGLIYWAVMGFVTGYLYRLYVRRHPLGMCIYPICFLTLTELPRYIFWGGGRAFPALAFLLLSAFVLIRSAGAYESFARPTFSAEEAERSAA